MDEKEEGNRSRQFRKARAHEAKKRNYVQPNHTARREQNSEKNAIIEGEDKRRRHHILPGGEEKKNPIRKQKAAETEKRKTKNYI